jgi:hypothetical protein
MARNEAVLFAGKKVLESVAKGDPLFDQLFACLFLLLCSESLVFD